MTENAVVSNLTSLSITELMALEFAEKESVLGDWFKTGSINMLFAPRGVGKTTIALGVGLAAARQCEFLGWLPDRVFKVAYFDSEMGPEDIKRKLCEVDSSMPLSCSGKTPIRLVCKGDNSSKEFNFSNPDFQLRADRFIEHYDVIILDNLLGLTGPITNRDDEIEIWRRFETWLTKWRKLGKAFLILHHTAKSGEQYGTILKENVCDNVIRLEKLGITHENGLHLNWHYTKTRWLPPEKSKSIRISYKDDGDRKVFSHSSISEANSRDITQLFKIGWTGQDIATMLNLPKGHVQMVIKGKSLDFSTATTTVIPTDVSTQEYDEDGLF